VFCFQSKLLLYEFGPRVTFSYLLPIRCLFMILQAADSLGSSIFLDFLIWVVESPLIAHMGRPVFLFCHLRR
jgi:hypothetical protein